MKNHFFSFNNDRGQTGGFSILVSAVVVIFLIGFLVMIFSLIGNSLTGNAYDATTTSASNESGYLNSSGYTLSKASTDLNFRSPSIVIIINGTGGEVISSGNYTLTGNVLTNKTAVVWNPANITYSYTYDQNTTAVNAVSQTVSAIAGVTTWFPIIITIVVMVVLILLVVLIIVAIRQSGILMQE